MGFGLWLAGWYLLLRKQWELPLGSIPSGELVVTVASAIIWGWLGFNVHKRYHRSDDDPDKREYEHCAWGLSSVAIAIAVIVGAAALWLTYG